MVEPLHSLPTAQTMKPREGVGATGQTRLPSYKWYSAHAFCMKSAGEFAGRRRWSSPYKVNPASHHRHPRPTPAAVLTPDHTPSRSCHRLKTAHRCRAQRSTHQSHVRQRGPSNVKCERARVCTAHGGSLPSEQPLPGRNARDGRLTHHPAGHITHT
jgi:hypothetical protein